MHFDALYASGCTLCISVQLNMHRRTWVHFCAFQYSDVCVGGCGLKCICLHFISFSVCILMLCMHFSTVKCGGCGWGSGGDLSVAATVSIRLVSYPPNISYTNTDLLCNTVHMNSTNS